MSEIYLNPYRCTLLEIEYNKEGSYTVQFGLFYDIAVKLDDEAYENIVETLADGVRKRSPTVRLTKAANQGWFTLSLS